MAQFAKLCFQDRNGNNLISGVTQLQKEGTHILLTGANDWNGTSASDRVYLLAPYDCIVRAIAPYDNTVFFESTEAIITPSGTYDHCWFMCTHMLDADKSTLGLAVGRIYRQGQRCYAEGTKGIGAGNHIHMEQGYGTFGGGTTPYKASKDTFKYNGTTYTQYYPVLAAGGKECPVADMMFLDKVQVTVRQVDGKTLVDHYGMRLVPDAKSAGDDQVYIGVSALRVRANATTSGRLHGYCLMGGYYNVLKRIEKAAAANKDYDWYQVGPYQWIAGVDGVEYKKASVDKRIFKIEKDPEYDYQWSLDGNRYGDKYDVTVMSGFGDTKLIADGWEEVLAVNGSLFYTYDNQHFALGVEKSRGVVNQELEMSCVTDNNEVMAIGMTYDGRLEFAKTKDIVANINNYYGAVTGEFGIMKNGEKAEWGKEVFTTQYNDISGRTIIGEDKEGNPISFSLAGVTGSTGLRGKELYDLCKSLGFWNAICFDGGGSVFRRINGEVDISTTRKVKNAVLLYRRKKQEKPVEPEPEPEPVNPTPTEDLEKLKAQIAELESKVSNLTRSLNDANTLLEQRNSEIAVKEQELSKKAKEAVELAEELSKSETECGQVKSQLNQMEEQLSVVKNDLTTAQTKIANAKEALN